jgi:hypothetical protein
MTSLLFIAGKELGWLASLGPNVISVSVGLRTFGMREIASGSHGENQGVEKLQNPNFVKDFCILISQPGVSGRDYSGYRFALSC